MATNSILDVLIIGGGPAGLSVATGLARQLYTAVVFDSGVYRNQITKHMHNVVTWDHQDPADFRKKGRTDILKRYTTIDFQDIEVTSVTKTAQGHFELTDVQGKTWTGRKLVLATGVRDVFPDIEGYGECWARGIFHCLFCHGYEEQGVPSAGVLAVGDIGSPPMALHMARMAKRLTPNVTIYTDGAEQLAQQTALAAVEDDVKVDNRPIALLKKGAEESSVVVHFDDGQQITEGFLVSFLQFPRIVLKREMLTAIVGTQTQKRSQRPVRAPASARTNSPGRHQDQWHVLRDQRAGCICGRGLCDTIEGSHAGGGYGLLWCRRACEPAADSITQGKGLRLYLGGTHVGKFIPVTLAEYTFVGVDINSHVQSNA